MKTAFLIAGHHLLRIFRNPGLLLLLIAIPFTLAVIEYAAFGRTAASGKLPPIQVLFLDEDRTFASQALPQVFAAGPMKDFFEVRSVEDRRTVRKLFQKNQASALVVAPEGFQDGLLQGQGAEIQIYKNPIQTFSPEIVESVLEMLVVIANGLYGEVTEPVGKIRSLIEEEREPTAEEVGEIAIGFFEAGERFGKLQTLQDLRVTLQRPEGKPEGSRLGSDPSQFFAFIFPGLVIFALLFISQSLALRLLRDRMQGLQRRLVTIPIAKGSILWGGILFLVAALFLLLIVLAILGSLVFGIRFRDPIPLLILALGLAVFAAGLQLTITGLAKTDRGASFAAGVIIMLLALLGGSFMPAEVYPSFLKAVAFRLPNGAAQQGIIEVLVHERPLAEITGRIATTWIWAALSLGTAIHFERRRLTT